MQAGKYIHTSLTLHADSQNHSEIHVNPKLKEPEQHASDESLDGLRRPHVDSGGLRRPQATLGGHRRV